MNDLEFLIGDTHGSKVVAFPSTHFSLGSSPDCELRFESSLMKGKHAEVFRETDGSWVIRDVSGSGTVWINGVANLEGKLEPGAMVRVGRAEIAVRVAGKSGPHMQATATPTRNQRPGDKAHGDSSNPANPDVTFRRSSAVVAADAIEQSHSNTNTGPSRRDKRHELQPGTIIDNRYKILGKLAAGGMGEVYKAEHVELGKSFAIKVMLPELSNDADFVARFKREAIASSRIGQQNIVDISDFGRTQEGRFFFVMEFIEGRTLASTVRRDGPLSMQRVVLIGLQVARALAAAHQQSIVHRDLKPENVMLLQRPGQADFVKVLDFGIAKVSTGHGSGGQTAIGMVVGTPQYMSPEQAAGLTVDPRTDIYALGLILYELVTGRPTFVGETPSILMALQMTSAPPPLEPGPVKPVTPELEALIFHMLQKKVDARPSSMEEIVGRLDEAMNGLRTATTGVATRKAAETSAALSALVPIVTQLPVKAQTQPPKSGNQPPLTRSGANRVIADQKVTEDVAPSALDANAGPPGDDLAAIKPNRMPLYAGLVALMVLSAGAVVFFSRGGSGSTDPVVVPPPPTGENKPIEKVEVAAGQVKIAFTSTPDKAEIFDGETLLGTTPFTLARDKGHAAEYRFVLAGHKPQSKKVRYENDTAIAVTLEKEPAAAPVAAKDPPPKEPVAAKDPPAKDPRPKEPVAAAKEPKDAAPKEARPKEPVAAKEPKETKPKEPPKETKPKGNPQKTLKADPYGDSKELKDLPD